MKIRQINRFTAIAVMITMLCSILGCEEMQAINLMDGIMARNIETVADMMKMEIRTLIKLLSFIRQGLGMKLEMQRCVMGSLIA